MSDPDNKEGGTSPEDPVLKDDEGNDLYGTPRGGTSTVARRLLLTTSQSTPEQLESVNTNKFFKHCLRILEEVCPDDETEIKEVLLELFLQFRIRSEVGLSLVQFSDLPDASVRPIWGVRTFRRVVKMLILGSRTMVFNVLTSFKNLREAVEKNKDSSSLQLNDSDEETSAEDGTVVKSSNSDFNLKAIQQIELKEYSGESDKYQDWFESTERQFGRAAAQPLLHDRVLCQTNLEVSYAAKCIVATSLENGSASYLNTTYKNEKNLAIFMEVLNSSFNNKVDARTREFVQWKRLLHLIWKRRMKLMILLMILKRVFQNCVSTIRRQLMMTRS